jgi:hypothetical protein
MTGAKKKPKSPGLIIWLLVFWPLEARGWGILTWSQSRRVGWVICCSYIFLEEMREMIPIVVGMTEPLPCERVCSFLGKSSLMHSVSWIRSLQLFLLERRENWNVLIAYGFHGVLIMFLWWTLLCDQVNLPILLLMFLKLQMMFTIVF